MVQRKLADKRARAFAKMQNEIVEAHRKAENRRAVAKASRSAAKATVIEVADKIQSLGKLPGKFDKIRSLGKFDKIKSLRKFLCL